MEAATGSGRRCDVTSFLIRSLGRVDSGWLKSSEPWKELYVRSKNDLILRTYLLKNVFQLDSCKLRILMRKQIYYTVQFIVKYT